MVYIAKEPLFVGSVRYANAGNVISDEAVKQHGWQSKVVRAKGAGRSGDEPDKPAPAKPAAKSTGKAGKK